MIYELRELNNNNTITVFLFLPIMFVFLMCLINVKRTKLLFNVFFSNEYFYYHTTKSFFSVFNFFGILSILHSFSLLLMCLIYEVSDNRSHLLTNYFFCLTFVCFYFVLKFLLGKLLSYFLLKNHKHKEMLLLENSYLASVLMLVFPVLCYVFLRFNTAINSVKFLFFSVLLLYIYRAVLLFKNNKNLLSGQMFYIILYLCLLEILPFIYFFKRYIE